MKKNLNDKRKHKKRRRRDPAAGAMLAVGLPMETDGSTAKVTMLGHRLALIENHRGVYAYTKKGITLTGPEGMLSVYGKDLEIRELDREQMLVEGYITGVTYE